MCGIVGFCGDKQAAPILLDGLSKLEYRGYDSAGLAVRDGSAPVQIVKAKGRLKELYAKTNGGQSLVGTCGIGHTRWATHGEPSELNAHPHATEDREVVGVHNGIIENYQELREKLIKKGYSFYSDTDTEVAVKLVHYYYKNYVQNPIDALARAMTRIRGTYALAFMFKDYSEELYVARQDNPMILGRGVEESFVASDVPALLPYTRQVYYIGNQEMARLHKGEITFYNIDQEVIEKELIEQFGIPYHGISTGKLRRYFSVQNFTDPFRVIKGLGEAKKLVKILHPDVIFSKGGFVSVPVVLAGKSRHVPTIIHESDMTPGLANKISMPSASKICCNFPETIEHLPAGKAVLTGSPIRQELLSGDKYKALEFLHFTQDKPVIMVVGGSLGSVAVNDAVRSVLPELLQSFEVVHLCGKGKVDESLKGLQGYAQFEYIKDELKDLFALTDLVISRAGANAICELLALHKPNLLIPLSANASRGDQILNARSFERQGYSVVLEEEELNHDVLLDAIMNLYQNRETYIQTMKNSPQQNSIDTIIDLIEAAARH